MKARQNDRIVSVAVIVAVGVNNSNDLREVLGMDMGPPKPTRFWSAFPRKLVR
ncbi:transposase [Bradyrhizobium sp. 143]|uniref:transposase n=1 Tax=Bradyrhizobium sp. 143 TaxID=2782619 RepID=UPI003208E122|nr:transposase [Bradyrhizobium sp. 143]